MIKLHYIVDVVNQYLPEGDQEYSRSFDSAEEAVAYHLEIQERGRLYKRAYPNSTRVVYADWPYIDPEGINGLHPLEFLRRLKD